MPPSFGYALAGPGSPLFHWSRPLRRSGVRQGQVVPPAVPLRQAAPLNLHRDQIMPPERLPEQAAPPMMLQGQDAVPAQGEPPVMLQEQIDAPTQAEPPVTLQQQIEAPAQAVPPEIQAEQDVSHEQRSLPEMPPAQGSANIEVSTGQAEVTMQPGQSGPPGQVKAPRSAVDTLLREAEVRREAALTRQRELMGQAAACKRPAAPALVEMMQRSAKAKPNTGPAAIYGVAALLQMQAAAIRQGKPSEPSLLGEAAKAVQAKTIPTVPPRAGRRVTVSYSRAIESLRKQVRTPVAVRSQPLSFVDRKLLERDVLAGLLQAHFCFRRRLRQGGNWRCINLRCLYFRNIYLHINYCEDLNCRFKPCGPSKQVMEHFKLCVTKVCLVCGPYKGAQPVINEPLDLSKIDMREFMTAGPIEGDILPTSQTPEAADKKPADANGTANYIATLNSVNANARVETRENDTLKATNERADSVVAGAADLNVRANQDVDMGAAVNVAMGPAAEMRVVADVAMEAVADVDMRAAADMRTEADEDIRATADVQVEVTANGDTVGANNAGEGSNANANMGAVCLSTFEGLASNTAFYINPNFQN